MYSIITTKFTSNQQFEDFLNCPMNYEDSMKMLMENQKITLPKPADTPLPKKQPRNR